MFGSVNNLTHRWTHGQWLNGYTISSPCEPSAQVSGSGKLLCKSQFVTEQRTDVDVDVKINKKLKKYQEK